jgi:hypothetical protein
MSEERVETQNTNANMVVMAATLVLLGLFIFWVLRGGLFGGTATSADIGATPVPGLDTAPQVVPPPESMPVESLPTLDISAADVITPTDLITSTNEITTTAPITPIEGLSSTEPNPRPITATLGLPTVMPIASP